MPPKKQKEDEVDLSSLPPWFAVTCTLKTVGKKQRMLNLLELVKSQPKSFQKNVSRDDIIEFAKEKGLYTDPNSLNEKQRKDPKVMESLNMEINASLIAKSFAALKIDLDLKGRKAKKDKLEGKEEVDEKKVDPKKKEAKKEAKKGGKGAAVEVAAVEVEEEKKDVEPEKEYNKALDAIYFLFDFPSAQASQHRQQLRLLLTHYTRSQDEIGALVQAEGQIDLCIEIREKILWNKQNLDMSLLDAKDDFDSDLRRRMNDFIDAEPVEEGSVQGGENKVKRSVEVLTEEELQFIEENKKFLSEFKKTRGESESGSTLRKTVVKEVVFEIDPSNEEQSTKDFVDVLIQEICQFSFDSLEYEEWINGKKLVPLSMKEALRDRQFKEEEEERARKREQELAEQAALEEAENQKKKGAKKETKKDTKKETKKDDDAKAVDEQAEAGAKAARESEQLKQQQQGNSKDSLSKYYRQLNDVKLERTTAGILLECLLDAIEGDKANSQSAESHEKIKQDSDEIKDMLSGLTAFVEHSQTNTLAPHAAVLKLHEESKDTPLKDVIDECDDIGRRTHKAVLENRQNVTAREVALFSRLVFPGIDRNLMPGVPGKAEELRKAEKSQMYPFVSCSIDEFERRLKLTRFEEMLREVEPEREWDFGDRILMERHSQNTLMQQLHKALLWEPHVLTKYNEADDSLQVAVYYKNPPGRILRRRWNADWKVFPNLENWISYFKGNQASLSNELFFDMDYERIGNIEEKTKYMFPDDNSVVFGTKFTLGGEEHYRYKVLKEGVTFGIKRVESEASFWAVFDSQTQLLIEVEDLLKTTTNNKQRNSALTSGSQEEDEESQMQSQQHQSQQSHQQQQQSSQQSSSNPVEQQADTLEQEEPKSTITLTLKNGLVVKFLANGDVFQSKLEHERKSVVKEFEDIVNPHETQKSNSETEIKRIVTGKGSVIKYMKDGSIFVLQANGNTSFAQSRTANWITTNNQGLRKVRNAKDGSQTEAEAIPCTTRTDPESGSKITIKADQTTIVRYLDGSVYTKHKDGTQMLTSPKKDVIIVEHPDYSTVKVLFDEVKARTDTIIGLGSAFANVGFDNLFERSNNGIIVETYLPDGSKVVGYREKRELPGYDSYSTHQIHLVYLQDGSIAKVVDNGEIVLISAVDRVALNAAGENKTFGQDIDFWLQLFCVSEERKAGVYTTDLLKGVLWTRDGEGNVFALHSNGDIDAKIAVSLNLAEQAASADPSNKNNPLNRPQTPQFKEKEFIEEENLFLPQPASWVPVRLFTVNNDNTGYELLSRNQVANYFRLKDAEETCIRLVDEQVPSFENCKSITFISQLLTYQENKKQQISPNIPRNLDVIPTTEKKRETPEKRSYMYRNFLEFDVFDGVKREQHQADLNKYEAWKQQQVQQEHDFAVNLKSEEERDAEFNLQLKIMENRKKK